MLKARLFGGLSVEIDGRRVPSIPGFKARSLFAYLVLHPGPHPRVRLAGTFWPDVLDASARGSLRVALWTVRRALEAVDGQDHLVADRLTAGLPADAPREGDTERFDDLLAAGNAQSLTEAGALYPGPLPPPPPHGGGPEARAAYPLRRAWPRRRPGWRRRCRAGGSAAGIRKWMVSVPCTRPPLSGRVPGWHWSRGRRASARPGSPPSCRDGPPPGPRAVPPGAGWSLGAARRL